jgi:uncharacterized membrane protein
VNRLHALTDGVYAISMTLLAAADPRAIRRARRRVFTGPVIFAVAIVIALFSARLGYALYFAALITYITIAVRDRAVLR